MSNTHLRMEMTEDQRHVLTMLGWYFLDNYALEARRVLVSMAEQDIPHSDGAMP